MKQEGWVDVGIVHSLIVCRGVSHKNFFSLDTCSTILRLAWQTVKLGARCVNMRQMCSVMRVNYNSAVRTRISRLRKPEDSDCMPKINVLEKCSPQQQSLTVDTLIVWTNFTSLADRLNNRPGCLAGKSDATLTTPRRANLQQIRCWRHYNSS